jgi:cell wall-associated NlpC family hydrolase
VWGTCPTVGPHGLPGGAAGTPGGLSQAVYAYNHSQAYAASVFTQAARYANPAASTGGPAAAAGVAGRAIGFALAQLGKPYVRAATGPDAYDCSGLVYAAYASAGIRIARTTFGWRQDGPQISLTGIQPGDLLFSAGSDGTPANLSDLKDHGAPASGGSVTVGSPRSTTLWRSIAVSLSLVRLLRT